ncbi:hypothetical protein Ddc_05933 [Ditylenchus destructor]|nr:hypothetical protein Ddc_05933 [Ditylenchus destructor]
MDNECIPVGTSNFWTTTMGSKLRDFQLGDTNSRSYQRLLNIWAHPGKVATDCTLIEHYAAYAIMNCSPGLGVPKPRIGVPEL